MNTILHEILESREVADLAGVRYPLNSEIDDGEGGLIREQIEAGKFSRTLEVGCAYGVSALYICEAISNAKSPSHTIIDPFQTTQWRGIGTTNLDRAGYRFYRLIEEPSEIALPRLLERGETFEFALIDGCHTLDHTLLDFFFVNRMLDVGGIVAIDDVTFPGIKKVIRYVLNYGNYELAGTANASSYPGSWRRRALDSVVRACSKVLPHSYSEEVFSDDWKRTDRSLGIQCSMVALRKTGVDQRPWNWYKPF